jgi:HAD superfamily hydrolase (TIGR01509 family)
MGRMMATDGRGVVFDLDGVLVDSEPLHLRAYQEVLGGYGRSLLRQEYYARFIVYSDREVLEQLLPDRGVIEAAIAAKQQRYLELVGAGPPAFADGLALLHRTDGWRVALATGSCSAEAELILRGLGIRDRFRTVVTADDCARGKPDPEPYLRAAQGLGLPAGRCVAVEDAPGGVRAAKTAGMRCVGVTHSCPRERLREADLVVDDLAGIDLAAILDGGEHP